MSRSVIGVSIADCLGRSFLGARGDGGHSLPRLVISVWGWGAPKIDAESIESLSAGVLFFLLV